MTYIGVSLVAQWYRLPANAGDAGDMGFLALAWKEPLEEEMTSHSSILAWEIP